MHCGVIETAGPHMRGQINITRRLSVIVYSFANQQRDHSTCSVIALA
jgi:hypothetical protein